MLWHEQWRIFDLPAVEQFFVELPWALANELPFYDCSALESVADDSLHSYDCDDTKISYPQKSGTLRVAHVNCRSPLTHKDDVLAMFIEAHLDILV